FGELIEDDGPAAGFSYKPNEEIIKGDVQLRKTLVVPSTVARKAYLLVGRGGDINVTINGNPVELGAAEKVGNYWTAYSINPRLLRPGENEIVLSGDGKLWFARADEFPPGVKMPG